MNRRKMIGGVVTSVIISLLIIGTSGSVQKRLIAHTRSDNRRSVLVKSDRPMGRHLFGDWYVVQVTAADANEALHLARQMPNVIAAEPDAELTVHQSACPPAEWYIENIGQFGGAVAVDTNAWDAWNQLRALSSPNPVRLAIIDSGVNTLHPRFNGVTFYAQKKFTDDFDEEGDPDFDNLSDVHGHGTAVAGVMVAMLPDPSWYTLGSYRVFDKYGGTSYSVLLQGLQAAVADGAQVINFSGGGREPSRAAYDFLASHPDVLFIFSAGNSGQRPPDYPAHDNHLPSVVSVAAIEQSGAFARFTNTGALLAAPGQFIFTSMNDCQTKPMAICQPAGYGFLSGTSFAAPIVSAVCAGRMLMQPKETAIQVRQKLLASVDISSLYRGQLASSGRVNFEKLVHLP
jgi:hypothetical protein